MKRNFNFGSPRTGRQVFLIGTAAKGKWPPVTSHRTSTSLFSFSFFGSHPTPGVTLHSDFTSGSLAGDCMGCWGIEPGWLLFKSSIHTSICDMEPIEAAKNYQENKNLPPAARGLTRTSNTGKLLSPKEKATILQPQEIVRPWDAIFSLLWVS